MCSSQSDAMQQKYVYKTILCCLTYNIVNSPLLYNITFRYARGRRVFCRSLGKTNKRRSIFFCLRRHGMVSGKRLSI